MTSPILTGPRLHESLYPSTAIAAATPRANIAFSVTAGTPAWLLLVDVEPL
jgi:hypothetical protein